MNPPEGLYELWEFSDPAASAARFESYAREARPAAWVEEAHTQQARALGLQGQFDEGRALLKSVLASTSQPRVIAAARLEAGRLERSSGQASKGLPEFLLAFQEAAACGADDVAADAAHMVAIVVEPHDSPQWGHRGIRLAEQSALPRAKQLLGPLHNNLGWTYFERGEFEAALAQFARSQLIREQFGPPRALHIAKWSVGRCLRALNRLDEALNLQTQLLATDEGRDDGFVHEERGECLLALDRPAEAAGHLRTAWSLLGPSGALDHEPDRKERLRILANPSSEG